MELDTQENFTRAGDLYLATNSSNRVYSFDLQRLTELDNQFKSLTIAQALLIDNLYDAHLRHQPVNFDLDQGANKSDC